MLYIHEKFLVYKLETSKNCKEVKYNMIMITAITYIFLSYVIFDQQLEITFKKSSGPPWKNPLPPFNSLPPKNSKKCKSPPFGQHWKFFRSPAAKKDGGGHIVI